MYCSNRFLRLCALGVLLLLAGAASRAAAQFSGTIAYMRGGKTPGDEIRLIESDGSNDRSMWKLQGNTLIGAVNGISGVSWRPDGKELVFCSDHDAVRSYFESNIYAIHPYGTGLRRLTDALANSEFGKYPKGKVVVTIHNDVIDVNPLIVYVTGADTEQSALVPAGGSKTLTFDKVAVFGTHPHTVVERL